MGGVPVSDRQKISTFLPRIALPETQIFGVETGTEKERGRKIKRGAKCISDRKTIQNV